MGSLGMFAALGGGMTGYAEGNMKSIEYAISKEAAEAKALREEHLASLTHSNRMLEAQETSRLAGDRDIAKDTRTAAAKGLEFSGYVDRNTGVPIDFASYRALPPEEKANFVTEKIYIDTNKKVDVSASELNALDKRLTAIKDELSSGADISVVQTKLDELNKIRERYKLPKLEVMETEAATPGKKGWFLGYGGEDPTPAKYGIGEGTGMAPAIGSPGKSTEPKTTPPTPSSGYSIEGLKNFIGNTKPSKDVPVDEIVPHESLGAEDPTPAKSGNGTGMAPALRETKTSEESVDSYGERPDGTDKGKGFLGELQMTDGSGKVATEISIGVEINGKETLIPSLVPALTEEEKNHLLSGKKPTKTIVGKARRHATERMKEGLSPFADEELKPQRPKEDFETGSPHTILINKISNAWNTYKTAYKEKDKRRIEKEVVKIREKLNAGYSLSKADVEVLNSIGIKQEELQQYALK